MLEQISLQEQTICTVRHVVESRKGVRVGVVLLALRRRHERLICAGPIIQRRVSEPLRLRGKPDSQEPESEEISVADKTLVTHALLNLKLRRGVGEADVRSWGGLSTQCREWRVAVGSVNGAVNGEGLTLSECRSAGGDFALLGDPEELVLGYAAWMYCHKVAS